MAAISTRLAWRARYELTGHFYTGHIAVRPPRRGRTAGRGGVAAAAGDAGVAGAVGADPAGDGRRQRDGDPALRGVSLEVRHDSTEAPLRPVVIIDNETRDDFRYPR
jgi:hypothetical protein